MTVTTTREPTYAEALRWWQRCDKRLRQAVCGELEKGTRMLDGTLANTCVAAIIILGHHAQPDQEPSPEACGGLSGTHYDDAPEQEPADAAGERRCTKCALYTSQDGLPECYERGSQGRTDACEHWAARKDGG